MNTEMTDRIAVEQALAPASSEQARKREKQAKDGFWSAFARFAARLPFAEDVAAAWYCAFDPKTPLKVRGTLIAALAYFVVPLDVVPDLLAFVGLTDDIAVLTAAFTMVSGHIRPEHREKARRRMAQMADHGDGADEASAEPSSA